MNLFWRKYMYVYGVTENRKGTDLYNSFAVSVSLTSILKAQEVSFVMKIL